MSLGRALLAGALAASSLAAAEPEVEPPPSPEVAGSLAWVGSDRLDLAGVLRARVPLASSGRWSALLDTEAVTAIRKAQSLTFLVDTVGYRAGLLARRRLGRAGDVTFGGVERGIENADAPGTARVRTIEAAWESAGYARAFGPEGLSGRAAVGVVVARTGIDATATAAGEIRWMKRVGRILVGAAAGVDALVGRDGGADATAGPRVAVDLGGDRRAGFFVSWLHGRNPFGLGTDGVLAGFDLAQGAGAPAGRPVPPEVSGLVAGGGGDGGRAAGRLLVRVATPGFAGGTAIEAEVDANVLTASDGNDLYYLYDVGASHPVGRFRVGGYFHHRSNHLLDRANPTVTSIDVVEAGFETQGYRRGAASGLDLGRAGTLALRVRAGWLVDSAFGEHERWHARGAARWLLPGLRGSVRPYVGAASERGDIGGSAYDAGLALPRGWDVRVEKRHDEQLYARDRRLLLALATLYF